MEMLWFGNKRPWDSASQFLGACVWYVGDPVGEWRRPTRWIGWNRPALGSRKYMVGGLHHWRLWQEPWLAVAEINVGSKARDHNSPTKGGLEVGRLPLHLPCSFFSTWATFWEKEGRENSGMRENPKRLSDFPRETVLKSDRDIFNQKGIFYLH